MKKLSAMLLVVVLLAGAAMGRITESLDDWTMGTNQPEIASTMTRGDGTTGNYIHLLIGTSAMYYEVETEGEGGYTIWVYDGGLCLETTDPGYGNAGPMWGMQSPLYQSIGVGVFRAAAVAGCTGYSGWSTVAPYSYTWFKDGLRASHGFAFTAGWFKWTIAGTWDDITYTIHDVTYEIADGPPHDDPNDITTGDCVVTYDGLTSGGMWEALFGEGWKAVWVRGDGASGIEDMSIDITGGTGEFETALGAPAVSDQYNRASWSEVKTLYR